MQRFALFVSSALVCFISSIQSQTLTRRISYAHNLGKIFTIEKWINYNWNEKDKPSGYNENERLFLSSTINQLRSLNNLTSFSVENIARYAIIASNGISIPILNRKDNIFLFELMSIPFLNASNGQHYVFTPDNNFIAIKGDGSFYTTVVEDCPKFSKNGEVCLLSHNTFLNVPTCQLALYLSDYKMASSYCLRRRYNINEGPVIMNRDENVYIYSPTLINVRHTCFNSHNYTQHGSYVLQPEASKRIVLHPGCRLHNRGLSVTRAENINGGYLSAVVKPIKSPLSQQEKEEPYTTCITAVIAIVIALISCGIATPPFLRTIPPFQRLFTFRNGRNWSESYDNKKIWLQRNRWNEQRGDQQIPMSTNVNASPSGGIDVTG